MGYVILVGDVLDRLRELPEESVHCVVTSPPYWGLRDYGTGTWEGGDPDHTHDTVAARGGRGGSGSPRKQVEGSFPSATAASECSCGARRVDLQIGLEPTPQLFLSKMVDVFREVRRVLRKDGTCWVNMGDSYAGSWGAQSRGNTTGEAKSRLEGSSPLHARQILAHPLGNTGTGSMERFPGLKPKDLVGMPWRLAFALQDNGWYLRQDIIWAKPNPMPESVTDRCTKSHEYVFLLTKSARYYYDAEAIKEAGAESTGPRALRAQASSARLEGIPGQAPHSAPRSKNGVSAMGGQGSNRDRENGPALRDGRDMSVVGVGAKRNKRSVWNIATEAFPEAHFATFPTALVEPCILAGTSEKGCCSKCGAPWQRITEKSRAPDEVYTDTDNPCDEMVGRTSRRGGNGQAWQKWKNENPDQTTGWEPTCICSAPVIPCTVLDPFNGSGTTGLVSIANRCHYIGIELKPEYAAMSERRLAAASSQNFFDFNTVEMCA